MTARRFRGWFGTPPAAAIGGRSRTGIGAAHRPGAPSLIAARRRRRSFETGTRAPDTGRPRQADSTSSPASFPVWTRLSRPQRFRVNGCHGKSPQGRPTSDEEVPLSRHVAPKGDSRQTKPNFECAVVASALCCSGHDVPPLVEVVGRAHPVGRHEDIATVDAGLNLVLEALAQAALDFPSINLVLRIPGRHLVVSRQ